MPLGLRLPNPPPLFVGRKEETLFLRETIKRAPISVVWGLGGSGKTSLVLHTLHRYFAKRVPSTVVLGLRAGATREDPRAGVIRTLAKAAGASQQIDWAPLMADSASLTATLIDVAESEGRWLVLEDAHHGDPDQLGELLAQVARYARNSRWIVVSRTDPAVPELADQTLALGGMRRPDLEELARSCAPRLPEKDVQAAISGCGGSPWLLRHTMTRGGGNVDPGKADLLDGLPAGALPLLSAFAIVERPLPPEAVAALSEQAPSTLLAELERRGLVEHTAAGWRLHDVARALLQARFGAEAAPGVLERVTRVLTAQDNPMALLEGLRLLLSQDRIEPARALLEEHGGELLKGGYALDLWSCLESATDHRLEGWRLRAAVELGSPEALLSVREPKSATLQDRFFWAKALPERGGASAAVEILAEIHEQAKAAGDEALACEAGLVRCRCLANLGCIAEATAALRGLAAPSLEARVLRDALRAWCAAAGGDREEPLRLVEETRNALTQVRGAAKHEASTTLVGVLFNLGRLRDAWELSSQVKAELENVTAAFPLHLLGRALLLHAAVATERGLLDEAQALLWGRLAPFAEPSSPQGLTVRMFRAKYRLWVGELKGLDEHLDGLLEEARRLGLNSHHAFIADARLRLHLLRAEPLAHFPEVARSLEPARLFSEPVELLQREARARSGEKVPRGHESRKVEASRNDELFAQARKVDSLAALAAGDAEGGLAELSEGLRVFRKAGFGLREAEALQGMCEIWLALDRRRDLAETAQSLARLAESIPSPRFALEAKFFLVLSSEEVVDPATLEELAAAEHTAPVAARRAQALLGDSPRLDVIDRLVIDRVRAQWGAPSPVERSVERNEPPGPPTPSSRWGLDGHRRQVWLQDGRRIDLSQNALLWRVLETLADSGGTATKEQLACQVWKVAQYHPFRHDNRLRLAMRKLREAIEEDPARPKRLVTTSEGYALGGEVLRLLASPSSKEAGRGAATR